MLRKFALVILAVSTLGVASLSPTPASAWRGGWYGGGWTAVDGVGAVDGRRDGKLAGDLLGDLDGDLLGDRWGPGWGWGGPRFVVAPGFYGGGCVVRRVVRGPWGPRRILINRCW